MKNLLATLLAILSISAYAQLTNSQLRDKSLDTYEFDYELVDDGSLNYPIMQKDENGDDIHDVILMNGIKVGYTYHSNTSIDDVTDWDASKRQVFYVTAYFTNMTGGDIDYKISNDIVVAMIRFPSKDGFFNDGEGKCHLRTRHLSDNNGSPIFKQGQTLKYRYKFSQISSNFIESSTQSHLYPMEVMVNLPVDHVQQYAPKTDLYGYKEVSNVGQMVRTQINLNNIDMYSYNIELPKKYVYLTSAYPKVISKHQFETNAGYTVLLKDPQITIEYKPFDGNGKFQYRITNNSSKKYRTGGPIAYLHFAQGRPVKLWMTGKQHSGIASMGDDRTLDPGETYTGEFKTDMDFCSGEYFKSGDKLYPRKVNKRYYVPIKLEVARVEGMVHVASGSGDKATIYVLFPNKSSSKAGKHGQMYIGLNNRYPLPRGVIFKLETSKEQHVRAVFDNFGDYVRKPKVVSKMMSSDPGYWKNNMFDIDVQPGQVYYYLLSHDTGWPKNVAEDMWNSVLNNPEHYVQGTPDQVISLDE